MKRSQFTISRLVVFVLIILHLFLLLNVTFTAWPEMFSFPYLVSNNFRLYSDFVHPYPPFLTLILSLIFKSFGYTAFVLRLVTYIVIVMADILIYRIVLKTSAQKFTALLALTFYVFAQPLLEGNMLWFDNALVLPLLVSYDAFVFGAPKRLSVSIVVASLIKQTALLYVAVYGISFILLKRFANLKKLLLVATIGWGILAIFLIFQNSARDFFMWNFWYPITQWSNFPGYVNFALTRRDMLVVLLVSCPVVIALVKKQYLIVLIYVTGLVSIYPRFSFFHMQPAIAIAALSLGAVPLFKTERVLSTVFVVASILFLIRGTQFQGTVRFLDKNDTKISQEISTYVEQNARILFVNIPSQYYVLSKHLPPKPWLDTYGWYYEMPGESERVQTAFKKSPPDYIIRQQPQQGSWYDLGTYEPAVISQLLENSYFELGKINQEITVWKRK